jgi:hypothetical protein
MKNTSIHSLILLILSFSLLITTGCEDKQQVSEEPPRENKEIKKLNDYKVEIENSLRLLIENLEAEKYENISRELKSISQAIKVIESQLRTDSSSPSRDDINSINQALKSLDSTVNLKDWANAKKEANYLEKQLERLKTTANINSKQVSQEQFDALKQQVNEIQAISDAINSREFYIPLPLLVAGGSGLIGGMGGLMILWLVILKAENKKTKSQKLSRDNLSKTSQQNSKAWTSDLMQLKKYIDIELINAESKNQERFADIERQDQMMKLKEARVKALDPIPTFDTLSTPITPSSPPPTPMGPSKESLIAALNGGDQQQLRDASSSELNITSESKESIAIGRSINTELREVSGGGSYLLVILQGQAWLFPTERSLAGFTASQRSKGIFDYEKQTISTPKLLEPALLERSGTNWMIKEIGKIAIA